MPAPDALSERTTLEDLAFLALALAHGADDHLAGAEIESIVDRLQHYRADHPQREVQELVMDVLGYYAQSSDWKAEASRAAQRLLTRLEPNDRRRAVNDLAFVARADGVVLSEEKDFLRRLAQAWGVVHEGSLEAPVSILEDLAYLYVAFAHATDADLSDEELGMIRRKVEAWSLLLGGTSAGLIEAAFRRYRADSSSEHLRACAHHLREALPPGQREDALRDLVQIANADGRFLDSEENILNILQTVWDIDPSMFYESRG